MKPLRLRIRDAARNQGIPQNVIEKDYALSYILAGIYSHRGLGSSLVFKGGTALKKLYFGEYRFSEGLDFSANDSPMGERLEGSLRDAVDEARRLMSAHGPFTVQVERYLERSLTPTPGTLSRFACGFPGIPVPSAG